MVTEDGFFSAFNPSITAVISMRLLVVAASPPDNSFSCAPMRRIAPQPPGPGFPEQAPSVKSSTLFMVARPDGEPLRTSPGRRSSEAIFPGLLHGQMKPQLTGIFARVFGAHQ